MNREALQLIIQLIMETIPEPDTNESLEEYTKQLQTATVIKLILKIMETLSTAKETRNIHSKLSRYRKMVKK